MQAGCKHCYDTPFASRPAARAKPAQARYQNTLPAAPTFYPTAEEWQDPFAYLSSIAPEATKAGIACIRPPQGWEPPIQMLDQQTGQLRTDLQVRQGDQQLSLFGLLDALSHLNEKSHAALWCAG